MSEQIPTGPYCYASLDEMDAEGHMKINGICPFWEGRPDGIFCAFLDRGEDEFGLLADQVKICDVKEFSNDRR